jgi:hypothetical protein
LGLNLLDQPNLTKKSLWAKSKYIQATEEPTVRKSSKPRPLLSRPQLLNTPPPPPPLPFATREELLSRSDRETLEEREHGGSGGGGVGGVG